MKHAFGVKSKELYLALDAKDFLPYFFLVKSVFHKYVIVYAMLCYAKSLQSCPTLCDPRDGHQAPPSLGFSRQEHWSGLPFPSPVHEREVAQSCPTLSDPKDCSLPGSSIHGIFQARVPEWGVQIIY